uniref:AC4 n=1 Tax=Sweet potato leaf curl Sichuan virus 1 TaxID=2026196 RepID=A0A1B1PIH9_9GEMI|nr:AC4 [Sweet potato leaf curl Sichuan virus 1]ANT48163.1 AC4 [Sweet potato leaf curl Sichuan virus 1]ANT48174.1 AC4 [Sweet potato leaf curl Sichuan virus 1]ANT48276.1 AC4 [Sweet potato leaf curl Sichuan virus 1]QIP75679.1 AC4 [Sweet potato leaf curl Sichuan virus 1]
MGACTSMLSSNSKVSANSQTPGTSTLLTPTPLHNTTPISNQQSPLPMSRPTLRRTKILLTVESSRSTEEVLEEVSKRLTMLTPRH